MSSKGIQLRDAIVDLLNDEYASFEFEFEAEGREAPFSAQEIEQLSEVAVSVFTGSVKRVRESRERWSETYKPAVVIQRRLDGGTAEANAALVARLHLLAEQIEIALQDEDLADLSMDTLNEEQDRVPYNLEMLTDNNVFFVAIVPEYTSG